jgi:hypothetical protein
VPSVLQGLPNNCATNTSLACAVGVNSDDLPTSFYRFVREFYKETTPTEIGYGFGQYPARFVIATT